MWVVMIKFFHFKIDNARNHPSLILHVTVFANARPTLAGSYIYFLNIHFAYFSSQHVKNMAVPERFPPYLFVALLSFVSREKRKKGGVGTSIIKHELKQSLNKFEKIIKQLQTHVQ